MDVIRNGHYLCYRNKLGFITNIVEDGDTSFDKTNHPDLIIYDALILPRMSVNINKMRGIVNQIYKNINLDSTIFVRNITESNFNTFEIFIDLKKIASMKRNNIAYELMMENDDQALRFISEINKIDNGNKAFFIIRNGIYNHLLYKDISNVYVTLDEDVIISCAESFDLELTYPKIALIFDETYEPRFKDTLWSSVDLNNISDQMICIKSWIKKERYDSHRKVAE